MSILCAFLLLHLLGFAAGFGVLWRWGRGHVPAIWAVTAAPAVSGLLLVVMLSLAGHRHAARMSHGGAAALVAAGIGFSLWQIWRDRAEIRARLSPWRRELPLILLLGAAGGALVVWRQVLADDFGFFELLNKEFYNYALFAANAAHYPVPGWTQPWIGMHAELRDGADFLTTMTALAVGRAPILTVQLSCALFRASYLSLIFTGCFFWGRQLGAGCLAPFMACLAFCLFPLDIWQFQTSWISADLALSFGLLAILLALNAQALPWDRLVGAAASVIVALLITYPECFPLFMAGVGLIVLEQGWHRCWRGAAGFGLGGLAVILINPIFCRHKLQAILGQFSTGANWNTAGDMVRDPVYYLSKVFGLEWVYYPETLPFPRAWDACAVALVGMVLAFALVCCRRTAPKALAWGPGVTVAGQCGGILTGAMQYGSLKLLLWFLWGWPLILVGLGGGAAARWRRALAVLAPAALALCYGLVDGRAFRVQSALPTFFSAREADAVTALAAQGAAPRRVLIADNAEGESLYWFQILNEAGLPVVYHSRHQAEVFAWKNTFLQTATIEVPPAEELLPRDGEELLVIQQNDAVGFEFEHFATYPAHKYQPFPADGRRIGCLRLDHPVVLHATETFTLAEGTVHLECRQ